MPSFARLAATDQAAGNTSTMEFGRGLARVLAVQLAIGPVLHPADAVANKLRALFGQAEVRDYIDVYGVLQDGRYAGDEMLRMAAGHDPVRPGHVRVETAGVRKTALAVHWGHRVVSDFPDGQIFVDLGGHDTEQPLTPLEVLAWFLRALGITRPEEMASLDERAAVRGAATGSAYRIRVGLVAPVRAAARIRR